MLRSLQKIKNFQKLPALHYLRDCLHCSCTSAYPDLFTLCWLYDNGLPFNGLLYFMGKEYHPNCAKPPTCYPFTIEDIYIRDCNMSCLILYTLSTSAHNFNKTIQRTQPLNYYPFTVKDIMDRNILYTSDRYLKKKGILKTQKQF